jgi:hypothetical protein
MIQNQFLIIWGCIVSLANKLIIFEMEASVEGHDKLRPGQVVWAKVFGFPWWPAYVHALLTTGSPGS